METTTRPRSGERRLGLTEIRESRGISLAEIAAQTKISTRFLNCIEGERFEDLPGGVYDVSYIRQYAIAIGYEESTLLDLYRHDRGLDIPPVEPPSRPAFRMFVDWFAAPPATQR